MEKNDLITDSQQVKSHDKIKKGLFSFLSKICFWIGVVLLFFARVSKSAICGDLYWGICWSFLCILAPFFGIIGNVSAIILHRGKKYFRYTCRIILEITVLVIFGMFIVPYIYAAPALDKQNLEVYGKMIDFIKDYNDLNSIEIDRFGYAFINNKFDILNSSYPPTDELEKIITAEGVKRLGKISEDFDRILCFRAFREYDFVFFISWSSGYKPRRFGVVYSLNGRNPNDIDIETFKEYRLTAARSMFLCDPNNVDANTLKEIPFTKIKEDWYTSRTLTLPPKQLGIKPPWPSASLIDHSLNINNDDLK